MAKIKTIQEEPLHISAEALFKCELRTKELLSAQREEMMEKIEKLRRTDDTQMNADHVYDEALDDVLSLLSQKKVDKE